MNSAERLSPGYWPEPEPSESRPRLDRRLITQSRNPRHSFRLAAILNAAIARRTIKHFPAHSAHSMLVHSPDFRDHWRHIEGHGWRVWAPDTLTTLQLVRDITGVTIPFREEHLPSDPQAAGDLLEEVLNDGLSVVSASETSAWTLVRTARTPKNAVSMVNSFESDLEVVNRIDGVTKLLLHSEPVLYIF